MTFSWLKGHGTENDFLLLPDHDGTIHGDLDHVFVAGLCNRRRGIGADGILRVIRSAALGIDDGSEWFMDYRNADGSISEMCGNGVRVFALHLQQEGLVDASEPVHIGTRGGVKIVTFDPSLPHGLRPRELPPGSGQAAGFISVDMGVPDVLGTSKVQVDDHVWEAQHIETGNPHAVVFVDDLGQAGSLLEEPEYDAVTYPNGVNIEFGVRTGDHQVAMRVYERGSGETRSCGTGACAVGVAAALADAALADEAELPVTYRIDVPGGTVHVTWREDKHLILAGPAEINARGEMEWLG